MYPTGDIRSAARKVNEAVVELKKQEQQMDGTVSETKTWWKGQAGETFVIEYNRETKQAMHRLYSEMNNMSSELDRLATEVRNADEAEAQRKAMAAAADKQKVKSRK